MLKAGDRVAQYEIIAPLKAGGMGMLFLGRRIGAASFSRPVAIKVLHAHLASDENLVRAFVDEALHASKITHPDVIHVEELGELNGLYYLVMEFIEGVSLAELMAGLAKRGRGLSPECAVAIAVRVAEGLHAAHELELVHRDVSPQNILLGASGNVKVIDFGIAKAVARSLTNSASGTLKGKIPYMSPEQARGEVVDRRSDIYALALVLWEMLTGRRVFDDQDGDRDAFRLLEIVRAPVIPRPGEVVPHVPAKLEAVVMRALSVEREARPAHARQFGELLFEALPSARKVDPPRLAELIDGAMSEVLKKQRELLRAETESLHPRFSRGEVVFASREQLGRAVEPFLRQGVVCVEGDDFPSALERFEVSVRLPGGRLVVIAGQIVSLRGRVALIQVEEPTRLLEAARAALA
jgi:eukaryotic-like serine/threonine-protein kinase